MKYLFAGTAFGLAVIVFLAASGELVQVSESSAREPEVSFVELGPPGEVTVVDPGDLGRSEMAVTSLAPSSGGFNLQELFVLDNLFSAGAFLDPDRTTIGDLLILDRIFNQ